MLLPLPCLARACKHYPDIKCDEDGPNWSEENECWVCDAFPEGIPIDIVRGRNLHTSPIEGDHGIQYEKDPSGKSPDRDDEEEEE